MSSKDTIRSLDTREQCRLRLPVWFGSRDNYQHGVREILANASDEISNNFAHGEIKVHLHSDNKTISIFDSGRGIPISGETNGVKNYELLFLTLFSGSNYNNLDNGKVTTGANGVGTCVLCHTSELFEVMSFKNNIRDCVRFKDGGELELKEFGIKSEVAHGTKIKFKLDEEMYTSTTYDAEEIRSMLKALAGANNKLTITFKYLEEEQTYHYDTIEEYLSDNSTNTISITHLFQQKSYQPDNEINSISCAWTVSTEPFQNTFLNYTNLIEQGTIYDGFIDGMKKVFTKATKTKFTNQDIEMSFGMVVSVLSNNVEFTNQTKFSTSKQLYKKLVSDYIIENMEIYKAENPQEFDRILKHLQQINTFNSKNEASRKKIKKELEEKANNAISRPAKLVPCRTKDPNRAKIALLEGDSALNSVKLGRDAEVLMVLPLKGKPINAFKCSLDKLLENQEVRDIFKILGCGITYKGKNVKGFNKFNIEDLCVCEVDIICDRDEDGGHLETLVIGLFYILAPELIKRGVVRVIETPLYIIKTKDKDYYAYSEIERVNIINSLTCQYKETRYKGIGGLPVNVMHMALADETKRCITITMKDAKKCGDMIELFLSDDIESRKKYISEHGSKYVSDDIYA